MQTQTKLEFREFEIIREISRKFWDKKKKYFFFIARGL